jgi:hypothetical protein
MTPTRATALCTAVLLLALVVSEAAARKVRHCNATVGRNKVGTLAGSIGCGYRCVADPSVRCLVDDDGDAECPLENSGCRLERIVVDQNAQLDLNGFDLFAVYHGGSPVVCAGDRRSTCRVKGPGMVYAGKVSAITFTDGQNLVLENLEISRDYYGIVTDGSVRISDLTMDCDGGILGRKSLRAKNVRAYSNCGLGSDNNVYLHDVRLDGAWAGGTLRGTDVTVGRITGRDVFLTRATNVRRVHSDGRLVLRDSEVGEIESGRKPRLIRSTCTESRKIGTSESWGVCALD